MFIEIDDLKQEPLHVCHTYRVGEVQFLHEDAALNEPVRTDFLLTHKDRDLRIGGSVQTAIRFKCSRCVKEFSRPFSTNFDLFYLPQPDWKKNRNDEIELRYEDMEVAYYDGVRFDVDLMVLEQIELGMPMKFVCRDDCKGLCYRCGADLNEGECPCKKDEADARLSVLLEFRKKMDEKA
ncbi:MAG TPA: DUF177 domain-containing protein [Acidobacteriota bacterium]|nr:DUF177 domain-containing protein [Acidobacteriota bacterium]